MRRSVLSFVLGAVAAMIVLWGVAMTATIDGISGVSLLISGSDSSIYAPEYTEESYGRVQTGMLASEVLELLGEPLNKGNTEQIEWWYYSRHGGSASRFRCVTISGGRVSDVGGGVSGKGMDGVTRLRWITQPEAKGSLKKQESE